MSRLTCAQCEAMLLDAADGLLLPEEQTQFEFHLAECPNCSRMYADVRRGSAWMELLKEDPPVPPDGMVNRILAKTSGDPVLASEMAAQAAYAASLLGTHVPGKVLPFRVPQPQTPWARVAHTVMQPRFMMTAAMAFFSIALTLNIAGVRITALRASDLRPPNLRKTAWAMNSRVVRYYDNLRVVYELESRVREMQRESDQDSAPQRGIVNEPAQQPSREAPAGPPRSSAPSPRHTPEASELCRLSPTFTETQIADLQRGSKGVQA